MRRWRDHKTQETIDYRGECTPCRLRNNTRPRDAAPLRSSCGLRIAQYPTEPIAPGRVSFLRFSIRSEFLFLIYCGLRIQSFLLSSFVDRIVKLVYSIQYTCLVSGLSTPDYCRGFQFHSLCSLSLHPLSGSPDSALSHLIWALGSHDSPHLPSPVSPSASLSC